MHPRFEIRLMTDIIVGECPPVTILRIAWEDKRDHVADWMLDYYRRYGRLPRGCHQVGKTPRHHLEMGGVDFDAAHARMLRELEIRRRMDRLLPRFGQFFRPALAACAASWVAGLLTWGRLQTRRQRSV